MTIAAGADINASDFITSSAGAGSAGKAVVTDGAGKIDISFIPYGVTAGKVIKVDSGDKLPTIDASQLINLPGLGAWTGATIDGAAHQVLSDGFIVCVISGGASGNQALELLSDSSNPPTTRRAYINGTYLQNQNGSIFSPIKKNDYYKITLTGNGSAVGYFIPIGA